MARIDVVDEGLIHASPAEVWSALLKEFWGETRWWLPELGFRLLREVPDALVGSDIEISPHVRGERWSPSFAFVGRVSEAVPGERLDLRYVSGAFLGQGEWVLEPANDGTRVRMRWRVSTHGLVPTMSGLFVNLGRVHSGMMQTGFRRLDAQLVGERLAA